MKYTRFYTDEKGETHFEDISVDFALSDFAPPAPPVNLSGFTDAKRFVFLSAPPGWHGDWHPAPRKQMVFFLSGEIEAHVSDGESRLFSHGDVILLEDTTGKGHVTRVVGDVEALLAIVQLED